MKRFICCSIIILISTLLCLGQSNKQKQIEKFITNALSTPAPKNYKPCYRPVVNSKGDYDLRDKKFYIAEIQYDSVGTVISESRLKTFGNYVRQSLSLRGAVEVQDKHEADFSINASIRFWNDESESGYSVPTRRVGGKGARADAWKSFRDTISIDWTERDKRYQEKVVSKKTYHHNYFHKMIEIVAVDKDEKPLFKSTVRSDNRDLGFRALNPNEVMLFLVADSYGNTARYGFNLDAYNSYLALFKKGELVGDCNVTYAPEAISPSKDVSVFLVDRQEDKTIVVVKDEGILKLDQNKNKTAMLKVGDILLPCSNMSYSATKIAQGVRLLTLEFPSLGDANEFDLLFCKKNKEILALNINLDRKEFKQIKVKNSDSHYNYYSDDVRQEQRWLRLKEKGRGWNPDMNRNNIPVSPTLYPDYSSRSVK